MTRPVAPVPHVCQRYDDHRTDQARTAARALAMLVVALTVVTLWLTVAAFAARPAGDPPATGTTVEVQP